MQSTNEPAKLAYSVREACQVTSLGKTTIYAFIAANRLQAIRLGGRTLILADSLRRLREPA